MSKLQNLYKEDQGISHPSSPFSREKKVFQVFINSNHIPVQTSVSTEGSCNLA